MITTTHKRHCELAPCGVYCGACPSFNITCFGCASDDKNQKRSSKWGCKIRSCCYTEKGLNYCIDCDQFPCNIFSSKLLGTHKKDPRFNYRFEIPLLLSKLKIMSSKNFIRFQKERWKCNSCGGTIRFYHYRCDKCGKESMVK